MLDSGEGLNYAATTEPRTSASPWNQASKARELTGVERTLDAAGLGFAFVSESPEKIAALRTVGLLIVRSYYTMSPEMAPRSRRTSSAAAICCGRKFRPRAWQPRRNCESCCANGARNVQRLARRLAVEHVRESLGCDRVSQHRAGLVLEQPHSTQRRPRLRPTHRDHVWSCDFVQDRTSDGRAFRMLTLIDESSRECLAIDVARRLTSEEVLQRLSDLFVWLASS